MGALHIPCNHLRLGNIYIDIDMVKNININIFKYYYFTPLIEVCCFK